MPRLLLPFFAAALLVTPLFAQTPAATPAAAAKPDPDFPPQPAIQPLSPADEAKTFHLPPGYRLEPVITDPVILEPTVAAFDGDGRLFVVEMRTYMQDIDGNSEFEPVSRVSLHWSSKKDGVFDRHTVFADKLVLPRIILPLDKGRALIGETNTNDLFLYTDTDGDGVADKKEPWFEGGPRGGNLEHQPNGLLWAIDNGLYSTYNNYRLRWTPKGPEWEQTAANNGQWGLAQDNYGKIFFMNAGGERGPQSFQAPTLYGQFNPVAQVEKGYEEVFPLPMHADVQGGQSRFRPDDKTLNHFTATCGAEVYRGDRLPAELQGNLFFGEPVGRLVRRSVITEKDGLTTLSNPYQAERSEFIRSSDQLFRPVNFTTGPDGALYLVDMYRGIIQEGNWVKDGSYLRKVVQQYSFDKAVSHGRIWRLVHETTKLGPMPAMNEESAAQLVPHLEHPNGWWRDTAQKLLILKQDKSVVPALTAMANGHANPLARLHALWTLEGLNAADAALVGARLKDTDPHLRAAAIRVAERLIKWGDKELPAKIAAMGADPDAGVQLQAMLTGKLLNFPESKATIEKLASTSAAEGIRAIADMIVHPPVANSTAKMTPAEKKSYEAGQVVFQTLCATCHGQDGRGMPMVGGLPGTRLAPSLAAAKELNGPQDGPILVLLHGLGGEIEGKKYEGQMVSMATFDDAWIANVLSYVRNSFGNRSGFITPQAVTRLRTAFKARTQPWTEAELHAAIPQPLENRKQWKLTASDNAQNAGNAVDGNIETRWDTHRPMSEGMWFQIELPAETEVAGLQLDYNKSANDFPRGYTVALSADGEKWDAPVAKGEGVTGGTTIEFPPSKAKFIRITQTGKMPGTFWSIHELQVLAPAKAATVAAK